MAAWYPLILLLHLSCAIVFVGAVAFEVLVAKFENVRLRSMLSKREG